MCSGTWINCTDIAQNVVASFPIGSLLEPFPNGMLLKKKREEQRHVQTIGGNRVRPAAD